MKKELSAISGEGYKVLFSEEAYAALHSLLKTENYSSVYILVDNHTQMHCLPFFLGHLSELKNVDVLKIKAGEENNGEPDVRQDAHSVGAKAGKERLFHLMRHLFSLRGSDLFSL